MHILIVDDEPNMLRTLADILRDEGFEVTTAASGEEAVELCAGNDYGVVLMDVRMPGIDGMEAFRRIRRSKRSVPVVLMSAYSVDHLLHGAIKDDVVAFVQKPLDAAKVLFLLHSLANRADAGDSL